MAIDPLTPITLFEENRAWAEQIARNVARKVPVSIHVEDLKQEALIELWKRAQTYDPNNEEGVPFRGYAYLAVRGACLMICRRRAYREAKMEELTDEHIRRPQRIAPTPQEEIDQRYRRTAVSSVLSEILESSSLKSKPIQILCAIYLDGADRDELAAKSRRSRGEITTAASNALRTLRAENRTRFRTNPK